MCVVCIRPHLLLQRTEYMSVFWAREEDEELMGVPVSPSGQDSLDVRTKLSPSESGEFWRLRFFISALCIFSPAWSSDHRQKGGRVS